MIQSRDIFFFAHQSVLAATPLFVAGVGELVAERSGVINIGIEGMMLAGCFAAYVTATTTGSGLLGVLAACGGAMLLAALFALVTVWWRGDQIVAGAAVNLLAAGGTATAWGALNSSLPDTEARVPVYAMVTAAGVLALALGLLLRRTRTGLVIRALGEAPEACHAVGVSVRWWRTAAVLFGGACAGAAGAYLSIMRIYQFAPDQTGGRGFLVLALVIFGRWNIWGLLAGCLLFGLTDDLQRYLQGLHWAQHVSDDLFKMLPYVATLAALAILTRRRAAPGALGRPWPEV